MPAPLIEFAQFAHPQRWWLRRGPPPWLEDDRWWVRAFRVSLVLGAMGTASGWMTVIGGYLLQSLEPLFGASSAELSILLGPGLWFGLGTLMPLSRWLGRGWIMTVLAVPVSMLACYLGFMTFFFAGQILRSGPSPLPWGKELPGFYAGFAGAFVIAVWMGHPLKRSAWLAVLLASGLASLFCEFFFLGGALSQNSPLVPGPWGDVMKTSTLYAGFQSLTAIGLGARLWWTVRENEGMRE